MSRAGLGLSLLLLAASGRLDAATGLEVGDRFPDLALPSLADGTPLSLRDYRGRKVVLHVFASW